MDRERLKELFVPKDPPEAYTTIKVLFGSVILFAFVVFLFRVDVDLQSKAPLFAIVAAAALCVTVIPRHGRFGAILDIFLLTLSGAAGFLAGLFWLRGVEQPTTDLAWALIGILALISVTSVWYAQSYYWRTRKLPGQNDAENAKQNESGVTAVN